MMIALGYPTKIRIHWYTPILCRFLGKLLVDPGNGIRIYTYRGVSLMCTKKKKKN